VYKNWTWISAVLIECPRWSNGAGSGGLEMDVQKKRVPVETGAHFLACAGDQGLEFGPID
jgi:hypothetical protein